MWLEVIITARPKQRNYALHMAHISTKISNWRLCLATAASGRGNGIVGVRGLGYLGV